MFVNKYCYLSLELTVVINKSSVDATEGIVDIVDIVGVLTEMIGDLLLYKRRKEPIKKTLSIHDRIATVKVKIGCDANQTPILNSLMLPTRH